MSAEEEIARYDWASQDSVFGPGATVSLVAGLGPAAALEALVPGRATEVAPAPEVRAWADGFPQHPWARVVEAGTVGDWTVVVEDSSGYQATVPGMVGRLSADGCAVVVSRNVNAVMWFGYAVGGVLVRQFDPLLYDVTGQVGSPLPEEQGLAFGLREDRYLEAALLLVERLTGLPLQAADLREHASDRLAVGFR